MRNKIIAALFTVMTGGLFMQANFNEAHTNSFGAPLNGGRGYTGSPFDQRSCNVSGCHSNTLNSGPGTPEITTDIPAGGYKAGQRYTITAKITQSGRVKFGFQLTAENQDDNKVGRFLAGSQTRVPSDFYVTQGTSSSSSSGSGSKTWTFTWDAPENAGTGPVTFYASFNAANSNGGRSGDNIYTTSLEVNESILSSVSEIQTTSLKVYPNPATDFIYYDKGSLLANEPTEFEVYDLSGALLITHSVNTGSPGPERIEISSLTPGLYLVYLKNSNTQSSAKLLVQ